MKPSNRQNLSLTGLVPWFLWGAGNEGSVAASLIWLTAIIDDSIGNKGV
jgi:hypothetical protein